MLDSLPLSEKLVIAQEWLRRTEAGEFDASPRHRTKFAELLRQCADEAQALVPANDTSAASNVVDLSDARANGGAR